jgi:glycine/D-amino acid oxidase-like deaminating enzyme
VTHRSLWLREAPVSPEPPVAGRMQADVCIVGGGFVGLWTAFWLKQWDPACEVAVLERDVCGGGASGRNGGFALSWWGKFPTLVRLLGVADAVSLCRHSAAAVDELARFPEAQFVRGGWLWTARTPAQLGAWDDTVDAVEAAAPGVFLRLEPHEVKARSGSASHLAGVLEPASATVHPGLLVRALREAVLQAGVRIFEGTPMTAFGRGRPVVVRTPAGSVVADTLVLATNAWSASIRELHLRLVIVSSDIVATPAIPDRLEAIGWTNGEAITDSQLMIDYYRTTGDGRIVFGKGGWGIALAGRVPSSFDRSPRRARGVEADFRHAYPVLADVPVELDWSGPIDRSADGLPILGELGGRQHILYGAGWSGNGVAPSVLGGKVLAARALGRDDDFGRFPLWNRRTRLLPPDPIRYAGAHAVREAVRRKELAEQQGREPVRLWKTLARLVPAGLDDH